MSEPVPARVDRSVRHKRRRRKQHPLAWLAALLALVACAAGGAYLFRAGTHNAARTLIGYVDDLDTLRREYERFVGKPLRDANIIDQFESAARLVRAKDYPGALAVLEPVSQQAPVPMVFNDLGVLYEQMNDRARAVNAFREALSRDTGYVPVRQNLNRLKNLRPGAADPVTHEVERNNTTGLANLIPLGQPVEAAIAGLNDEDYFRFTAPPAPRDLLEIKIDNRSQTLAPGLAVYDAETRFVGWGKDTRDSGASMVQYISPAPNSVLYLQIWGHKSTEGEYVLSVRPLKAFDAFEPNDDIFHAARLDRGQPADANIMDDHDTDFYMFSTQGTGTADVVIENLSTTLVPALSVFSTDRRFIGFGPDTRKPGSGLKHSFAVEDGKTYYLQVWSQSNSAGAYRITVQQ